MTPEEFRKRIRVVIEGMGLWSSEAEDLLLETAIHESGGFKYKRQLNDGPARSYFQIEPETLQDLYDHYLKYRPELRDVLNAYLDDELSLEENLENNLAYSIAAARLQYLRKPGKIPDTIDERAAYWKRHWNTHEGKGTLEKYINDFNTYVTVA